MRTFLLTDIEGSTRLWDRAPEAMSRAFGRHQELVAEEVRRHGGTLPKAQGEGDSALAVFESAGGAVSAACRLQQALTSEPWPNDARLRVRMAVHTGEAELRDGDYFGSAVNRCARLRSLAHGGQVLVSEATAVLARESLPRDAFLRDLGSHRLKDLSVPERVFQLCHPELPGDFPPLRTDAAATNLPHETTSFVGREREVADVLKLLESTRLLTLTGAGGAGKTRLALHVASRVIDRYPHGVWLVELAPLGEPELLVQAAVAALGLREQPGRTLEETLIDHLRTRELLLLFDNCEHLVERCAALVDSIVRSSPDVRVLATSREPLRLTAETTWRVPSLEQDESVELFRDRAARVKPGADFDYEATSQICRRLDGIPLAIELAAARASVLSAEEIARRLDDRFGLLVSGARTALPRQQTLRALVDWSYDLLSADECLLFERLSVFLGGFTLEAAEEVCSAEGLDVLDALSRLVDKSLVVADAGGSGGEPPIHEVGRGHIDSGRPPDQTARYGMLETIRQYASERLDASGAGAEVAARHAGYFVSLSEMAEGGLEGTRQAEWLRRLEADLDNIRAAIRAAVAPRALAAAASLHKFWVVRGLFAEGREILEQLLRAAEPDASLRQKAHAAAGVLARNQADHDAARAHLEESVELAARAGDERSAAVARTQLAAVLHQSGKPDEARQLYRRALDDLSRLGEERGRAGALIGLGVVAISQGDYAGSIDPLEDAARTSRRLGDVRSVAVSLYNLGQARVKTGDTQAARACLDECVAIAGELGDKQLAGRSLQGLADVAMQREQYEESMSLFESSIAKLGEIGDALGEATALCGVGDSLRKMGRFGEAAASYERSLELFRSKSHSFGVRGVLYSLGALARERGDIETATRLLSEALDVMQTLGDRAGSAVCLVELGRVQLARGSTSLGVRLLGAAQTLYASSGLARGPAENPELAEELAAARGSVGETEFSAAWAEGETLPYEEAVALAQSP